MTDQVSCGQEREVHGEEEREGRLAGGDGPVQECSR